MLMRRARVATAAVTAIAVLSAQVAPAFAKVEAMTRLEYEACQARDEQSFRSAIAGITTRALTAGLADFDYKAAVGEEWRKAQMDEVLDKRVDGAADEVRNASSWGTLIQSLADSKQAQKLATEIAERVYRSDEVRTAIEQLAAGVGRQIGRRMEIAGADAAEPALACLQAFLGPRYGTTVARTVAGDAGKQIGVDPTKGEGGVNVGGVLKETSGGLAGAAILMVRGQLANMAERIGARLVGSILSRLVSLVAGGVGLVLIAKDLWDLRHGVLPIIASEMKSDATKDKVREELAKGIAEQIGDHIKDIGTRSADHVVEVWQGFRRAHAKALELAEGNNAFKTFLNGLKPDRLARLDEVVGLIMASEGEGAVLKRLDNGTLDEAVNRLPAPAIEIARETRSIDAGLKWAAVSGDDLAKTVENEIYRRARPENFTRASLQRLLALDDRLAIGRLAGLPRDAREVLLDAGVAKQLARTLTEVELETLASYLTGLKKEPREAVMKAVGADPAVMRSLAPARVRNAILDSRDQAAAVAMMLQPSTFLDVPAMIADARAASEGRISPVLIWEKHPAGFGLAGALALAILLLLRRLLMPRRHTPGPPAQVGAAS